MILEFLSKDLRLDDLDSDMPHSQSLVFPLRQWEA